jgi:hypothetical protein
VPDSSGKNVHIRCGPLHEADHQWASELRLTAKNAYGEYIYILKSEVLISSLVFINSSIETQQILTQLDSDFNTCI